MASGPVYMAHGVHFPSCKVLELLSFEALAAIRDDQGTHRAWPLQPIDRLIDQSLDHAEGDRSLCSNKTLVLSCTMEETETRSASDQLRACNGNDIVKSGRQRKNRYLFALPGLVAPHVRLDP